MSVRTCHDDGYGLTCQLVTSITSARSFPMKILGPTAIGNGVGGIGSAARHLDPIAAQKWIPLWLGYGGSGLGSIGNGVGAIASGARPLVPWVASTMILVLLVHCCRSLGRALVPVEPLDALGLTLSNRGLVEARFTKKGYWWAEWFKNDRVVCLGYFDLSITFPSEIGVSTLGCGAFANFGV
ncbi:hypothetical protein AMTR_s00012p00262070 [Amborella trichopoda]|uniref:Uncharacterized protein n=1 Tax=Amborella trichopoda TaxID=13333 RepID=W1PK56_AMBTC|nr:hypothetical protein AMTR_s00012p00262070 [Amborella trichopoda]